MRLYIIRHADPDYPNNTITPAGHLEAAALGKRMAAIAPTHIYSSPLGRARDTARYTCELMHREPIIEEWTAELSDIHAEGEPWGKMAAWDWPGEIIRGGESMPTHADWHRIGAFQDPRIRDRIDIIRKDSDAFVARHGYERVAGRYRPVHANRDRIAVFCHGGFGLCWLSHLLEIPVALMWSGFFLPPSSVTTVLFDERSSTWAVPRCLGVGDLSHLYAAGLKMQPAGIKANVD